MASLPGTSVTLTNIGATVSLCISFVVLAFHTPISDLQNIFVVGEGVTAVPWIGDFISGIRGSIFVLGGFSRDCSDSIFLKRILSGF